VSPRLNPVTARAAMTAEATADPNAPRLLDLFCGAGGASQGYVRAGFRVTGVDLVPQPYYPHDFRQADAMDLEPDYLASFDAIHASPPCQRYSGTRNLHGDTDHPDLIGPVRAMLQASGRPWVLENVEGAPLRADFILCGSMFGLRIAKHRIFELGFPAFVLVPACAHEGVYDPWHGLGRRASIMREAQGTPWIPMAGGAKRKRGETGDLYNAIPPPFTEFLGRRLLDHMEASHAPS
jgi:DNA (cytosine-5)-methyltransferase 1